MSDAEEKIKALLASTQYAKGTSLGEAFRLGLELAGEKPNLTKRELFAAMAMQGFLANNEFSLGMNKAAEKRANLGEGYSSREYFNWGIAAAAANVADALLAELEKK